MIFNPKSLNSDKIVEKKEAFIRTNGGSVLEKEYCIFLDVETVPRYKTWKDFEECEPHLAKSFIENKAKNWLEFRDTEMARINKMKENGAQPVPYDTCTEDYEYLYQLRAGLFPEYNKIICISIAYYKNGERKVLSFVDHNEKELLKNFVIVLDGIVKSKKSQLYIVGHNVLLFDLPVLYKRMIVNGILPPYLIHKDQTKPWEKFAVDTRNIWKAGDKNGDATLNTMCYALGVKSPKDGDHNMDGSKVAVYYYTTGDLKIIAEYCEEDVVALCDVFDIYSNLTRYSFNI